MKITHYTIAENGEDKDGQPRSAEWFVRQLIEVGWQPYGSPFVLHDTVQQAMVKYEVASEN